MMLCLLTSVHAVATIVHVFEAHILHGLCTRTSTLCVPNLTLDVCIASLNVLSATAQPTVVAHA